MALSPKRSMGLTVAGLLRSFTCFPFNHVRNGPEHEPMRRQRYKQKVTLPNIGCRIAPKPSIFSTTNEPEAASRMYASSGSFVSCRDSVIVRVSSTNDYWSILFNIYIYCLVVALPSYIFFSNAEITNFSNLMPYIIIIVNVIQLFY